MHERAHRAVHRSLIQVRIIQDNRRRLTAQLKQHRLDVLASRRGNDRTDQSATCEVDLANSRVSNQRVGDSRRIGNLMEDDIQTASRKTSLAENIAEGPEALGRELGTLEYDCVTRSERDGNCACAQDERGVPAYC